MRDVAPKSSSSSTPIRETLGGLGDVEGDPLDGHDPDRERSWCVDLGTEIRPMSTRELWDAIGRGRVPPTARAWRLGREVWEPVAHIDELSCSVRRVWGASSWPAPEPEAGQSRPLSSGPSEGPSPSPDRPGPASDATALERLGDEVESPESGVEFDLEAALGIRAQAPPPLEIGALVDRALEALPAPAVVPLRADATTSLELAFEPRGRSHAASCPSLELAPVAPSIVLAPMGRPSLPPAFAVRDHAPSGEWVTSPQRGGSVDASTPPMGIVLDRRSIPTTSAPRPARAVPLLALAFTGAAACWLALSSVDAFVAMRARRASAASVAAPPTYPAALGATSRAGAAALDIHAPLRPSEIDTPASSPRLEAPMSTGRRGRTYSPSTRGQSRQRAHAHVARGAGLAAAAKTE
jgi:hypothetical protein